MILDSGFGDAMSASKSAHSRGRGRPSAYRPEFCGEVVSQMGQGYSLGGAAGAIGAHRDTLYAWARRHPEFSDSLKKGAAASSRFWEERLIELATSGRGSAAAVISR